VLNAGGGVRGGGMQPNVGNRPARGGGAGGGTSRLLWVPLPLPLPVLLLLLLVPLARSGGRWAAVRKDAGGCGCATKGLLTQELPTGATRPTQSAPAPRARAPATVLRAEAFRALRSLRAEELHAR
jgi:hypothetical protein